jgi:acyl carrier protein
VLGFSLVLERNSATVLEHSAHCGILEEDIGLEVGDAGARRVRNESFDEVSAQPATPVGVNSDCEIAITVVTQRITRLADDRLIATGCRVGSDDRDHAIATTFCHRCPGPTPVTLWRTRGEEPLSQVGRLEREIQRIELPGIVGRRRSNQQRSTAVEIEHLVSFVGLARWVGLLHSFHASSVDQHVSQNQGRWTLRSRATSRHDERVPPNIGDPMTGTQSSANDVVRSALAHVASDRIDDLDRLDPEIDVWRELDLDSLDHVTVMELISDAIETDIAEHDYPRLLSMRQLSEHVERALR